MFGKGCSGYFKHLATFARLVSQPFTIIFLTLSANLCGHSKDNSYPNSNSVIIQVNTDKNRTKIFCSQQANEVNNKRFIK